MSPRTIVLLVLAVLLPAGSLGAVGWVLVRQQQEVLRLREQDRSLLRAREAGDSLTARLDRKAHEVVALTPPGSRFRYPGDRDLLFLGRVTSAGWQPPYELSPGSRIADSDFQSRVQALRRAEAGGRSVDALLQSYSAAEQAFSDSAQTAYLRIQQARLLQAARPREAVRLLVPIARTDAGISDEFGNPLAFYAMELLGTESPRFTTDRWLNPAAQEWLLDLDSLASDEEHALARFAGSTAAGLAGWTTVPEREWLIGRIDDVVLGIRVRDLGEMLSDLEGSPTISRRHNSNQITLAPNFPGLTLQQAERVEASAPQPLWTAGLALILLLSSVAGFLLLRDYRREKRLATLRADFVSSVSHEVRTPLAAIRLYTESLLKYGSRDEEKLQSSLSTIADETHRLTRMLDNVLLASRIERGAAEYHLAEDRVDAAVHRAVKAMTPALEGAECAVSVDADAIEARIDGDAIEQAVVNLLSNAAKYAPGSQVRVTCEADESEIRVSVEDAGPGIDPAESRHVFEAFFRGSSSNQSGTGLGLSVVQEIAKGHGGEASLTSTLGEGSRFTIQLPRTS